MKGSSLVKRTGPLTTSSSTTKGGYRAAGISLCLTIVLSSPARAQFPLQSADGTSGLLSNREVGLINYEASESRVGFRMVTGLPTRTVNDPTTTFIFDTGFSANKGTRDLFEGGAFTPGYDLAFTVSHTSEHQNAPGYRQVFLRAVLDSTAQKTVTAKGSTLTLDSEAGVTAGAALGYNYAFTENLIWGGSVVGQRLWNSTDGLDSKTVCVQDLAGTNTDGNVVTVSDCEDRFIGPLANKWGGQVRSDLAWNAAALGGEDSAMIGLLASASADVSQRTKTSFNISVGPAIFRPNHPTQVVFAALVEAIDIGNRLGQSPDLSDQLRFRVYVGLPVDVLR